MSKNRPYERLIIRYLLTANAEQEFKDFFDYCNVIDFDKTSNLENVLLEELVIKLTLKEKELKVIGRPFGSMTFPLRMLTQVMQNAVGEHMVNFEQYQALKLSELEIMKRLHSFVMFRRCFPNHSFFMISLDAEGWCTKWRDETVKDVMREMFDNQFNTSIF